MFLLSSSRTSREMPSSPCLAHKEPVMQALEGKWSPRLPGGDERVTKRSAWSLVSIFRYWVGRGRRKESMGLICVDPQVNKEPKKKRRERRNLLGATPQERYPRPSRPRAPWCEISTFVNSLFASFNPHSTLFQPSRPGNFEFSGLKKYGYIIKQTKQSEECLPF